MYRDCAGVTAMPPLSLCCAAKQKVGFLSSFSTDPDFILSGLVAAKEKEVDLNVAREKTSSLLNEPVRHVESRETDAFRDGLKLVLDSIRKHLPNDTDYHLERFESCAHALRKVGGPFFVCLFGSFLVVSFCI